MFGIMKGKIFLILWSALAYLANVQGADGDGLLRSVKQGQVQGKILEADDGKPFEAYLGIPFGKVNRRFTSPEPAGPWNGIHDGTKDSPACKQYDFFFRKQIYGQEDCLTLNVYTPKKTNSTDLLPVMVFIYGGGFVVGEATSTVYGPTHLMKYPIVLVLMNYRIGALGFLSTGDEASPGNYGLLDQVLALQWIKDNIAAFGGDSKRVTITGESAGGGSVAFQMLSPLSNGLFHGAIAQSGATLCPWSIQEQALNLTKTVAEKLNCTTSTNKEMVECLRNADVDDMLRAENETSHLPYSFSHSFGPVVEPIKGGKFLTEDPLKVLKEGRFNKVPIISGVDSYESSSTFPVLEKLNLLPVVKNIDDKNLDKIIDNLVSIHQLENKTDLKAIKETYFEDVDFNNTAEVRLKQVDLSSDFMFKSCNDKTVKLLSSGGIPVYMYVFDYATPEMSPTNYSGKPDASHGMELYFLFNISFIELTKNISKEALTFGKRVTDLWTNFVIFGNPTPSGPVSWTPTPPGAIKYLNITENMEMVDGYLTEEMQFWDDHLYDIKKD